MKSHREPSVRSISSSDISSEASSVIHQRSTPKIAAVIIAAIIVIALLIGITVYLVDTDRLEKRDELMETVLREKTESFYGKHKEGNKVEDPVMRINPKVNPDQVGMQYDAGADHYHDGLPYMTPFKSGKDPEGPITVYDEYEYYEELQERPAKKQQGQLVIDGEGFGLSKEFYESRSSEEVANEKMDQLFGDKDFNSNPDDIKSIDRLISPSSIYDYDDEKPYGTRLDTSTTSEGNFHLYNMEPYKDEAALNPKERENQRFYRPQMDIDSDPRAGSKLLALSELNVDFPEIASESEIESVEDELSVDPPVPPNGSRGGIHVPVSNSGNFVPGRYRQGLPTLDRRPGRPPFHHMGPPRFNPALRRRLMRPLMYQQRRNQFLLGKRMGMLPSESEMNVVAKSPVEEAKDLLGNFDSFIALAKSEAEVLRDITKNITDSGKQVNLYEILNAVNNTIKDKPDSAIAKLMDRFYNKYLMEEETNNIEAMPTRALAQEKNLSSLLFLAFGIFLLNSVNQIILHKGPQSHEARALDDNSVLNSVLASHKELKDIFVSDPLEPASNNTSIQAQGSSKNINSFLRLLMNLMNAYNNGSEHEIDCIWSLYCKQLNRQASMGGMYSSIARINSVGMKVMLNQTPSSSAMRQILRSMLHWEEVPCENMFPKCDVRLKEKEEIDNENNE